MLLKAEMNSSEYKATLVRAVEMKDKAISENILKM